MFPVRDPGEVMFDTVLVLEDDVDAMTVSEARRLLKYVMEMKFMESMNILYAALLSGDISLRQLRISKRRFQDLMIDVAIAEGVRHVMQVRGSHPWDHAMCCLAGLADSDVIDLEDLRLEFDRRVGIERTADKRRARRCVRWLRQQGKPYHRTESVQELERLLGEGRIELYEIGLTEKEYQELIVASAA